MSEQRKAGGKAELVIFKEIMKGDRRKLVAASNDTPSGGGARDLRFNHEGLAPAVAEMFPGRRTEVRRRDNDSVDLTLYTGRLVWLADSTDPDSEFMETEIVYESPTDARPAEGRIATVHAYPPLKRFPADSTGAIFLLLVFNQFKDVWAIFATHTQLKDEDFNRDIADAVLACKQSTPGHRAAQGFVDLRTGRTYCNARDRTR